VSSPPQSPPCHHSTPRTPTNSPTSSAVPPVTIDPVTNETRPRFVCPHSTEPSIENLLDRHMDTLRPMLNGASKLMGSYDVSNMKQELAHLETFRPQVSD
jgi:hypothetical protein